MTPHRPSGRPKDRIKNVAFTLIELLVVIASRRDSSTTSLMNPLTGAGTGFQGIQLSGTGTLVNTNAATNGVSPGPPASGGSWGVPAYVEASVTVLENQGATLWGAGNGTGSLSPATLKWKYGQTLTRKIPVRSPW